MKRQGMIVTTGELYRLIEELEEEFEEKDGITFCDEDRKFQINIINKEGLSDTWEIETSSKTKEANNVEIKKSKQGLGRSYGY